MPSKKIQPTIIHLELEDNRFLAALFGDKNHHITRIETLLDVEIGTRGNVVTIVGEEKAVEAAYAVIQALYHKVTQGFDVGLSEVDATVRFLKDTTLLPDEEKEDVLKSTLIIPTRKKAIHPRTPKQAHYIKCIEKNDLVFGVGPAGTGKTYLAVACGVSLLLEGKVERLILSRPAVEAGERLGFLPGDIKEKIDPYLQPLYDALRDMMPSDQILKRISLGEIEVAPLAFMRGRTLSNAFIILDEAQNTTSMQMRMFLTRLGENSRMVITGDLTQVDLPKGTLSGLKEAVQLLKNIKGIDITSFTSSDVVRHSLVTKIVNAYDASSSNSSSSSSFS